MGAAAHAEARSAEPETPSSRYDVLGFLFTNRCNFKCRHCCAESHSRSAELMEIGDILERIDEAASYPHFMEIGISGGEPFLYRKHLAAICRHAAERGLSVAVTTNAFWALSPEAATERLRGLRDDGLRCLNISTSQFHLEFIHPDRLRYAARAGVSLGLIVRVNCVFTNSFGVDDARALFGDVADAVEFIHIPCVPSGRAAEAVAAGDFPVHSGIPYGTCAKHFTKLAISTSGDVFPCCSPGGFTEPLKVGNVWEQTIGEVLESLDDNLLVQVLSAFGPAFFVPFVSERLGAPPAGPFVDQCHLCHTMMSDTTMRAVIAEALDQLRRDLASLEWDVTTLAHEAWHAAGADVGGGPEALTVAEGKGGV
ncbi:MAG: hypothetical protein QOE38_2518 [Thermoleophilaceae bacterium]|jgi:MoaA/NifB/PqqE/SkfB family radical SAM enzyme|nr:hypothetical protein [Thermoleophilaceae bacterium]